MNGYPIKELQLVEHEVDTPMSGSAIWSWTGYPQPKQKSTGLSSLNITLSDSDRGHAYLPVALLTFLRTAFHLKHLTVRFAAKPVEFVWDDYLVHALVCPNNGGWRNGCPRDCKRPNEDRRGPLLPRLSYFAFRGGARLNHEDLIKFVHDRRDTMQLLCLEYACWKVDEMPPLEDEPTIVASYVRQIEAAGSASFSIQIDQGKSVVCSYPRIRIGASGVVATT